MGREQWRLARRWLPLLMAAAPAAAGAQAPTQDGVERWGYELNLALTSVGGNEDLTVLTTEMRLTRLETDAFELELTGRVRYGRSQGQEVSRNLLGSVKLDLVPEQPWTPFIFSTVEHDRFRKLDLRVNSGGGVKYNVWRSPIAELSTSLAALHSHENFVADPALPAAPVNRARWSLRVRGFRALNDALRVEHLSFYQPVWDQAGDYLFSSRSSARLQLTTALAFGISYLFERDSTPPPEVEPDDHVFQVDANFRTRW